MLNVSKDGSKRDIDAEGFRDGRFYILGIILWLASLQLIEVIISFFQGESIAVLRSILSFALICVILYFLYRGRRFAQVIVIIIMLINSLTGFYRGIIGDTGLSTLSMIHAGLMLIGAAVLWYWKPVQTFLMAQRMGIAPGDLSNNTPDDISWIFPPQDVHNPDAWDIYWKNQLDHGLGAELFDIFCSDDEVVKAAQTYGLSTILCIGNGISQEPVALSWAGFKVTAMDISPVAVSICHTLSQKFNSSDSYFHQSLKRPGGSIKFVVGDLFNENDCPGPYDVIIERRTIQDYPQEQQVEAVTRMIARLANKGIIVSHCHDNRFNPIENPGAEPVHATKPLIAKQGIKICGRDLPKSLDQRIAVIVITTG